MFCNIIIVLILAFLSFLGDLKNQEGASQEDIEQLSKFKFQRKSNEKLAGDTEGPVGGIMSECHSDSPTELMLSAEDAVCSPIMFCPHLSGLFALSVAKYHFNTLKREIRVCFRHWIHYHL